MPTAPRRDEQPCVLGVVVDQEVAPRRVGVPADARVGPRPRGEGRVQGGEEGAAGGLAFGGDGGGGGVGEGGRGERGGDGAGCASAGAGGSGGIGAGTSTGTGTATGTGADTGRGRVRGRRSSQRLRIRHPHGIEIAVSMAPDFQDAVGRRHNEHARRHVQQCRQRAQPVLLGGRERDIAQDLPRGRQDPARVEQRRRPGAGGQHGQLGGEGARVGELRAGDAGVAVAAGVGVEKARDGARLEAYAVEGLGLGSQPPHACFRVRPAGRRVEVPHCPARGLAGGVDARGALDGRGGGEDFDAGGGNS